jgi:MFS family permease
LERNRAPASSTPAQRWVLALTALAALMVMLDLMVVTTALTTIRQHLGASIEELEWTINAYTLSLAVLLMTAAALGDRFGRRRLFIIGIGLFTAASAVCALAPGVGWLIAARAVQGAGSAMVMPHALALLSAAFPPARRARALGLFASVTGLATLGGPMVGGAVTQGLAWQWIFWINVPIGLLLIPLARTRIQESFGTDTSLDFGGLALATGGALGLVWALVRGNAAGWTSAEVVASLTAGALLVVAFVAWELRAREPMLPMRFFRSRAFSSANATSFLLFGSVFGMAFLFAQFLQTAMHYGPLDAGLRLAPWTGTLFVVAPAAFGWVALIADPGVAYPALVAPLVLAGCGISMAMPAVQHAVIGSVPRGAIGKASGAFNTLRQLGGTFGIATLAAVFAGTGGYASPQAFSDGFVPAVGVAAGLALAAAVTGLWTPGRRRAGLEPAAPAAPPAAELQVVGGE